MMSSTFTGRRHLLKSLAAGSLLMPGLLSELLADTPSNDPLAPKPPHFPGKAKSCILMYMSGGVSQVDTFDYKPMLQKMGGKRMPLLPGVSGQIEAPNQTADLGVR